VIFTNGLAHWQKMQDCWGMARKPAPERQGAGPAGPAGIGGYRRAVSKGRINLRRVHATTRQQPTEEWHLSWPAFGEQAAVRRLEAAVVQQDGVRRGCAG
jgi:hypothetical protein